MVAKEQIIDTGRDFSNGCRSQNGLSPSLHDPEAGTGISRASSFVTVRIAGEVVVQVPNSLELITPYILREQENWFEDEIKFLRKLIRPGARIIDVGANYGTYTLSLARIVGDRGHVWAFEPAGSTAGCLRASAALNRLNNISVIQSAVSNRTGKARLHLEKNSELNRVVAAKEGPGEEINLTTLDRCQTELGFGKIDFLKIDAEGEEKNVVLGGKQLLTAQSPLIMFELKHGDTVNLPLIGQFRDMGYAVYRLVPGLDLLIPFGNEEEPDSYLLNLFCCKEDRALELEKAGWLIRRLPESAMLPGDEIRDSAELEADYFALPFARTLRNQWLARRGPGTDAEAESAAKAIQLYFLAHSINYRPDERYAALKGCLESLERLTASRSRFTYLSTYIRVAAEMGYRGRAARAVPVILDQLRDIVPLEQASFNEPFLPASRRFDRLDPQQHINNWFLGALGEASEILSAYSSFYTGDKTLPNMELLRKYGFQSPEMERRRQLIRMRHGMQDAPEPSPLLAEYSEFNLNPELWAGPRQEHPVTGTDALRNAPATTIRKLHIGGQVHTDGWEVLNIDPAPYVDHVCSASDLSVFPDNSFDEIYASHVLEHLDYTGELSAALQEWRRALKPGGRVYVSVPDMDTLAALFLLSKERLSFGERFEVMCMLFGGHISKHDYHVVGLNEEFLTAFLTEAGFANIRRVGEFGLFNDSSSFMFRGMPVSLNMIAEKPADMTTGRNDPCPCGSGQKFKHCHGKMT